MMKVLGTERSVAVSVGGGAVMAVISPITSKFCAALAWQSHLWPAPWTDFFDFVNTNTFQSSLIVIVMGLLSHVTPDTPVALAIKTEEKKDA